MNDSPEVRAEIVRELRTLSEDEQKLLRRILEIERDQLYSARPQVKDDIVQAIQEVVK